MRFLRRFSLLFALVSPVLAQSLAPVPVDQTTKRPVPIQRAEPTYSEEARRAKVGSTVALKLVIAPDGVPTNIQVIKPAGFGLDEKAIEAVEQWRFEPGEKDGVRVPVAAQVEIHLRLLDKESARASLVFDQGGSRPVLLRGEVPLLQQHDVDGPVRVDLLVDELGKVSDINIAPRRLPDPVQKHITQQIAQWRFQPRIGPDGRPAAAHGVLELR
jgi:TonB family protein